MFLSYSKIKKINKEINKEILIGKKGITENTMKMIKELINKKKALKIRVLKNCPLSLEEIYSIFEREFIVLQKRGRTFVILDHNYLKEKQSFKNKK
ncbi:MAG TPA: hypothetical protein EYH54_04025 [Nautiliaceae bacterium]|nr:hypothetical protein [Nautiliaceae bacterium]